MARLNSFIFLPMITIVTFALSLWPSSTAGPWPSYVRVVYDFPMQAIREFGFLADYAMSAAEQIKLKAALLTVHPLSRNSTLNRLLRLIDIRTALEDTQRLRFDLG